MGPLNAEQEHLREELAKWLLKRFDSREERKAWLERFEVRHGKQVADDIRDRARRIYAEAKA